MLPEVFVIAFLKMYNSIIKDGRGAQLFGEPDLLQMEKAFCLGVTGSEEPTCYWEFPLGGKPALDLLLLNSAKDKALSIISPDYPYKEVFEAAAKVAKEKFCYGLEWDLSTNVTDLEPGFYIDHASDDALVHTVLTELGVPERLNSVSQLFAKLPDRWGRYYLGLFPNRRGVPVRIGLTVERGTLNDYRKQPSLLAEALRQLGFTAFTPDMLEELLQPVYAPFGWDLQLDVFADGTLGGDLGLSYYFNKGSNEKNLQSFQSDEIQKLLLHLEALGLADARWRLLPECLFSKRGLCFSEGKMVKLLLENRFNFLKVKWRNGKPLPAKFYFESRAVPK